MSHTYPIEPLTGADNYSVWRMQVETMLMAEGLYGFFDGSVQAPTADNAELHKAYVLAQATARAKLFFTISKILQPTIHMLKTAKEIWDDLEKRYTQTKTANVTLLKHKLYSIKLDESGSVDEYFNTITTIVSQIKAAQSNIDDSDVCTVVLLGLPESYSNLRHTVSLMDTITLDKLKFAISQEALYRSSIQSVPSAFVVKGKDRHHKHTQPSGTSNRGDNSSQSGSSSHHRSDNNKDRHYNNINTQTICSHCHKSGHVVEKC